MQNNGSYLGGEARRASEQPRGETARELVWVEYGEQKEEREFGGQRGWWDPAVRVL